RPRLCGSVRRDDHRRHHRTRVARVSGLDHLPAGAAHAHGGGQGGMIPFHRLLISTAIVFCAGFAVWAGWNYRQSGEALTLGMGDRTVLSIPHSALRIRLGSMSSKPSEKRQVVRFAFYKLDGAWRRLSAERQASSKIEFGQIIESFAGRLLLRPYGLVGIRGDCDFLLWQVAENLDALVALQTALNRTDLGAYLASPYSYVAITRRSFYEFPEDPCQPSR